MNIFTIDKIFVFFTIFTILLPLLLFIFFIYFKRLKRLSSFELKSWFLFDYQFKFVKTFISKILKSRVSSMNIALVYCFLPFFLYFYFTRLLASNGIEVKLFAKSFVLGFALRLIIFTLIFGAIFN